MNSTLTLKTYAASTNPARPAGIAPRVRALAGKWDMLAVISLMASSAVYAVYALTQMTEF